MQKLTVKQNPEKPVPDEVLAESIVAISAAFKKIQEGPLEERALVMLIQDAAPGNLSARDIKAVLRSIRDLESLYVKPKKGSKPRG